MSKEDIDKAVAEAEKFAEEDKRHKEDVDARNEADQMVYQVEKLLNDNADKFDEADKSAVSEKVNALKEALKGDNIEDIKAKKEELTKKFYEISEKLYKAAGAQAQGDPNAQGAAGDPGANYTDFTEAE